MRGFLLAIVFTALVLWPAAAPAQPKSIPQIAKVPKTFSETFRTLKNYFSPGTPFTLVTADEATGTIVAKRSNIDQNTWSQWAYCKLSPLHMLDSLEDGSVMVNVKVERAGNDSSYVTVSTNFEGTYGLASQVNTTQCTSRGVLEKNILAAIGAPSANAAN